MIDPHGDRSASADMSSGGAAGGPWRSGDNATAAWRRSSAADAALAQLLREVQCSGTLCEESLAWVKANAPALGEGRIRRLYGAWMAEQHHATWGIKTGGAVLSAQAA